MKKLVYAGFVLLLAIGSVTLSFAETKELESQRGGPGLQNVHDKVLCADGFKVFKTIAYGFNGEGGVGSSEIQLMEEVNGKLVPVRCSK